MPKVVISHLDEGAAEPLPPGMSAEGRVESRRVLGGARPIHLWFHRLAPGGKLRWRRLPVGHVVYQWSGSMAANGRAVSGEGAVAIEHGASCEIVAGPSGCELVEFNSQTEATKRAGGHVHVLGVGEAPVGEMGEVGIARAYADSGCPTCELWLHENGYHVDHVTKRHYHDQDEVIVCIRGELTFGARTLGRGGVLAVDKQGLYVVGSKAGGGFINFRPGPPSITVVGRNGARPPKPEMMLMRAVIDMPPHEKAPPMASVDLPGRS